MKVLVTREIPRAGIEALKKHPTIELDYRTGAPLSQKELKDAFKNVDGAITVIPDQITQEIINDALNLKIISQYSVGFDNIDIKTATTKGIYVSNTPNDLEEATAEFALTTMLALAKKIIPAHNFTSQHSYKYWDPMAFLGSIVTGKTLGIIGFGRIGQSLAKMARNAFDMQILYYDIKRHDRAEAATGAMFTALNTLLKNSDFVSLHTPLLPSTKHIIGAEELRQMKSTAFLVNTSRGPVINEAEVFKALKEKRIAGAALDVFENEPNFVPGLEKLDNVILTPHIASATKETRIEMARIAVDSVLDVLINNKPPKNLVNKELLEKLEKPDIS